MLVNTPGTTAFPRTDLGRTGLQPFIVQRSQITAAVRAEMLELHERYFDNVQPARFEADLGEKHWVILIRDRTRLVGFSTQMLISLMHEGCKRQFLFSGDTVVDRAYWREHFLAGCFGHLMLRLISEHNEKNLFWFLICKGYRTYRFLPVFFHQFHPRPDAGSGGELQNLLQVVATARYGTAFDSERGVIAIGSQGDRLRPEMCEIPKGKQGDPFVEFFLRRNPRFFEGNELACLAPIQRSNLNGFAWRVIERTKPIWVE